MIALYIIIFIETILILTLIYLFAAAKERLRNSVTTRGNVEDNKTEENPCKNHQTKEQRDNPVSDNIQNQNNQCYSNEDVLTMNTSYTTNTTAQQYSNKYSIDPKHYQEMKELLITIKDQLSIIAKKSNSNVSNGNTVLKEKKKKSEKNNKTPAKNQGKENKETETI